MFLKKLELHNNTQFALNDVVTLKWSLMEPLQIIVGKNGAGKSTLLSESNTLPANPSRYGPGGYKKVWFVYGGKDYYASSVKGEGSGMKHSLVEVDPDGGFDDTCGLELNEGGTSTVQKDLIMDMFGYSDKLHKIMTGGVSFVSAGRGVRKDMLMAASTMDMSYANEVHVNLKTSLRNTVGAIDHIEKKLADELGNLALIGDITEHLKDADAIEVQLSELRPFTINKDAELVSKELDYERSLAEVSSTILRLKRVKLEYKSCGMDSLEQAVAARDAEKAKSLYLKESITGLLDRASKLADSDNAAASSNVTDTELEDNCVSTRIELDRLHPPSANMVDYTDPLPTAHNAIERALADFKLIEIEHPMTDLEICTPAERTDQVDLLESSRANLAKVDNLIFRVERELDRIESLRKGAPTCDNCGTLVVGDVTATEGRITKGESKRKGLYLDKDALVAKIDKAVERLAYMDVFVKKYRECVKAIKACPSLTPLWSTLDEDLPRWAAISTSGMVSRLIAEYDDVGRAMAIKAATDSHDAAREALAIRKQSLDEIYARDKLAVSEELASKYADLDLTTLRIKDLSSAISSYKTLVKMRAALDECKEDSVNKRDIVTEALVQQTAKEEVNRLQLVLGKITHTFDRRRIVLTAVDDLKADLAKLIRKKEQLSNLCDSLLGVINTQMNTFIEAFLETVNGIIASVWEYDMVVMPSSADDDGLDYRFPVMVKSTLVPEISKASAGQKVMIDFAINLTLIKYLGLESYPIYLDEPGKGFDEIHTPRFLGYLRSLIEAKECEQMLMVSHFSADYSGMPHSEVVSLSPEIQVPGNKYNDHMSITKRF